jgi:hypothetical protein
MRRRHRVDQPAASQQGPHFARFAAAMDEARARGALQLARIKGPGAFAAAQAASTRRARACARPILLIRPCWAKPSPD